MIRFAAIYAAILLGHHKHDGGYRFHWRLDDAGLIHVQPFRGERVNPLALRKIDAINRGIARRNSFADALSCAVVILSMK